MLSIKNLTVTLSADKKKEILHDISFDFYPGKVYVLMGPNGSGKSTLARSIMGDSVFHVSDDSVITLDEENITHKSADKRAHAGLFLSAQSPLAISGVTVRALIRAALKNSDTLSPLDIKKKIDKTAQRLSILPELLDRSLNDGFSGGERKKMEVLQMAILDPRYIILDEIDTGVDVDALKTIATFFKKYCADTHNTLIIITHATRILRYLTPDETLIIRNGRIVLHGDATLAMKIEKDGFDGILNNK